MPRALLLLAAVSLTSYAADWPQYRGPAGDGSTPEKIATTWAGGPKVVWKTESTNGFSSFAVGGGRCFTLEGRDADGIPQEVLVARDINTGKEVWTAGLGARKYDGGGDSGANDNKGGDGPRSTPTIVGL